MSTVISVALAGYGSAGRGIHAPLLLEAGMTVAAVSTSSPDRVGQVREELPGAQVVPDLDALLALGGIDLVVLATPSGDHVRHALQVVAAGIPVVVDKPLATDAGGALSVVQGAARSGVPLTVFQNRRYDAEFATLREVVRSGGIDKVFRAELRWERWRPIAKQRWREQAAPSDGGGILLDLQSHLVDGAVQLFGPVASVYAEIAALTTPAEDTSFLACRHASGVMSHLGSTSVAAAPGPRMRVLGRGGAFVLNEFADDADDVLPDFANADADHSGWIYRGAQRTPVPKSATRQVDFYREVAAALSQPPGGRQAAMPVDPLDAVHTLAVLDAARVSSATGAVVPVVTPQTH